jgi:hypothetical protein
LPGKGVIPIQDRNAKLTAGTNLRNIVNAELQSSRQTIHIQ